MVLCDRSYVRPITYADLTRPEKIKADLWFQNEERRRRRTLTDEEHERRMDQISEKVRNVSLVRELPDYKCSARPLSNREIKTLGQRRKEINKAMGELSGSRADETRQALVLARQNQAQDDPEAPDYIPDRQLALMNDEELGTFMNPYVEGRNLLQGVRDELCTRIARLALSPLPVNEAEIKRLADSRNPGAETKMLADYYDFMNEERRLILRTIRGANAKKPENTAITESWNIEPATRKELGAFLEADALEDYTAYFEGKREIARSNAGMAFQALSPDMWRSCDGFAPTSFDDPVDVASNLGGTEEKREAAKEWCLNFKQHKEYTTRDTRLATLAGNPPRPCKRWQFPFDKNTNTPLEGYWTALKRLLQVKNELGLGGIVKGWKFSPAYDADPLIATSQKANVIVPIPGGGGYKGPRVIANGEERAKINSDVCLMLQLFRKYGGEKKAQGNARFGSRFLEIELLRCYPMPQREDSGGLNSILAFVCWWHKTITTNDETARNLYEQHNPGKTISPTQMGSERRRMIYDLMCCPDGLYESSKLLQKALPNWANGLRSGVMTRVGELANFMPILKNALDVDVFQTPKEQSVLWRGGYLWYDAKEKLDQLYEPYAQLQNMKTQMRALHRQMKAKKKAAAEARNQEQELLRFEKAQELEYEQAKAQAKVMNDRLDALDDEDDREAMMPDTRKADDREMDLADELGELQNRRASKQVEASQLEAEATTVDADARRTFGEIKRLEDSMSPEERAAIQAAQDDLNDAAHPSHEDEKRGREVYRQWMEMNPLVN